jgi:hypothetical protein
MLSNMRLCANVPGQWAIQTALGGYQSINDLVGEGGRLRRQRDLAYELITAIPGVTCVKPQAALYMFPRLDPKMYPIEDDQAVLHGAAAGNPVMLVQGTGFNWPGPDHFRIVFLPHEDDLREAIGPHCEVPRKLPQRHVAPDIGGKKRSCSRGHAAILISREMHETHPSRPAGHRHRGQRHLQRAQAQPGRDQAPRRSRHRDHHGGRPGRGACAAASSATRSRSSAMRAPSSPTRTSTSSSN